MMKSRLKSRKARFLILALVLSTLVFSGCSKFAEENSDVSASKNHLRVALIALDRGDEQTAESELHESIKSNPLNSRARSTLVVRA